MAPPSAERRHKQATPLFGGIGIHLLLLVKQKHTEPPAARKHSTGGRLIGMPLWPQQTVMMVVLLLVLIIRYNLKMLRGIWMVVQI